jgi:hypothetical protein
MAFLENARRVGNKDHPWERNVYLCVGVTAMQRRDEQVGVVILQCTPE